MSLDETGDIAEKPIPPKRIDLASIMERMDETELVVALVAINPALEDILPEDEQLKRDVASVRQKLAENHLRLNDGPDSPSKIGIVVKREVHVHLWDEKTRERLKELGTAVLGVFQNIKDKLVEAKAKYIDGDGRDVITFEEAYAGLQAGLRGMADFVTRRDRSSEPASAPWPTDAPDRATADPSDPKIKWWGYVLGNFGAVPSKEYLENLQLKRDAEATKDVVRLASSAVDEVLDDELEPVNEQAAELTQNQQPSPMVMIAVKGEDTYLDDGAEPSTFLDETFPVPLDRFIKTVSDQWSPGDYDLAEDFYGRDDDLLKLVAEVEGNPQKFEFEPDENVITNLSATISNADEVTAFLKSQMPEQDPTLYVVRSTTPHSPHYITDTPGKTTYNKKEAALFTHDDAELLAGDHSSYAASKGYPYRYRHEEAGQTQAQQLRAAATVAP